MQAEAPQYDFWMHFWECSVRGDPLPWEMLLEISQIPDEHWDKGLNTPTHIAPMIREIWERHAAIGSPYGKTLSVNSDTGLLRVEDAPVDCATLCQSCSLKLKEVSELLGQFDNYCGALKGELFLIRRAVDHHPENPVVLHFNARSARQMLPITIANWQLPGIEEEPVFQLLDATLLDVETSLEKLGEVVEANDSRGDFSRVAQSPEIRELAANVAQDVAEVSEGRLREEVIEDAEILSDSANSEALREVSAEALASRGIRIWIAARMAQARSALKASADFSKDVGIVVSGAGGVTATGVGLWDKIVGSTHLADFVQKVLPLIGL